MKFISTPTIINSLKSNFATSIALTIVLFTATYYIYGFYYGWTDDVLQNNSMMGVCLNKPVELFFEAHLLLIKLYNFLYTNFQTVAWYGWIFAFYAFLATFNLFYFISLTFSRLKQKKYILFILLCFCVYFTIWIENIFLINFTRISIILIGTSLLLIDNIIISEKHTVRQKTIWLIYSSITLLIGVLTRPEIIIILFIPFILYVLRNYRQPIIVLKIIIIFIINGTIFLSIYNQQINDNAKKSIKKIKHILNVTEGKNTNDIFFIEKAKQDIRYKAVWLYYWPDSNLIDETNLSQWGPEKTITLRNLKNLGLKLNYEYYTAINAYNSDYCNILNWFYPAISLLFLNILILLINFISNYNKNKLLIYIHLLLLCSFIGTISLITILSKMEGRLLIPTLIIITLFSLSFIKDSLNKEKNNFLWTIFILAFISLSFFRAYGYYLASEDKKEESLSKSRFIEELNSQFNGKTFMFDILTISLLHESPFKKLQLNPANTYSSYKENWSVFFPEQMKYLKTMCGSTEFVPFYNCIYEKGDDVIFVYTKETRIGLIEEYALKVHDIEMEFTEIHINSNLKQVKYTFIPYKFDFGYYILTKFKKKEI